METKGLKKDQLAPNLEDLVEQLRLLEAVLTSSRTRLSAGKYVLDGEEVDVELLAEFKKALDHTRHSVWALLDAMTIYSGHSVEEVLRNYRMQRASELLHALRGQVETVAERDSVFARTFLEEVQIVAELACRRNLR